MSPAVRSALPRRRDPRYRALVTRDERLARILLHVVRFGSIATATASELNDVDRRIAATDLKHLSRRSILAVAGRGRHRHYVLDPRVSEERLSVQDRISLLVGREVTRFLEGTGLFREPGETSALLRDRVRYLQEPARTYAPSAENVDRCLDALAQTRTLALSYEGRNGIVRWEGVQPLLLVVYRRALYLVGRSGKREYTLAIDRMSEVAVGGGFDWPTDWDPDVWLAGRFGLTSLEGDEPDEVVLEFSAEVAHLVRARIWHATQEVETLRDGRARLRMVTHGAELVRFVLEWGRHCRVVAPADLRDKVLLELRGALAAYGEVR